MKRKTIDDFVNEGIVEHLIKFTDKWDTVCLEGPIPLAIVLGVLYGGRNIQIYGEPS